MRNFYFTFCLGTNLQHGGGKFTVISAKNGSLAREKMLEKFGTEWAFQYSEDRWFRDGISQQERFGLIEVPSHQGEE